MQNVQALGDQIKRELKRQGITQKDFSKVMGTSVPTIKRWLRGEGVLLKDWIKMLECLGMGLAEVAAKAEGSLSNTFTYTVKQEQLLSSEAGILAFFDCLLKGKTPAQVGRRHSLTEDSIIFYLSKLEKIGLIEWLPKNKVKILVQGEPSWINGGPLSQKFRRQILDSHMANYLNHREHLKISIYSLSNESSQKLPYLMTELLEKVRGFEIKDTQSPVPKKLTTVILGHGNNEVPILTNIPNKLRGE